MRIFWILRLVTEYRGHGPRRIVTNDQARPTGEGLGTIVWRDQLPLLEQSGVASGPWGLEAISSSPALDVDVECQVFKFHGPSEPKSLTVRPSVDKTRRRQPCRLTAQNDTCQFIQSSWSLLRCPGRNGIQPRRPVRAKIASYRAIFNSPRPARAMDGRLQKMGSVSCHKS